MDFIFVQPVDVRIANRENDEQLKLFFFLDSTISFFDKKFRQISANVWMGVTI